MARLYSYIYQAENKRFCIVHSLDGYDEISLTDSFKVVSNRGEQLFSPADLGFEILPQESLDGGDSPEDASKIFRRVLAAEGTKAQMNAVLANAAFGIQTIEQEKPIGECLAMAKDSLYGKKALRTLEKFIETNQE